ncbi:5-oxoprolinase subunit PxpB [Paenibacillus sp. F411]|uniref:5-oxoprolinase subunit PxpB n=1 Tax=Paenibacillus sp. F411 TaxID=2820239 RepID=UPI0024449BB8|nr:5-oxoprolinase subunit PxpB [Paenibacillus sp. F411]
MQQIQIQPEGDHAVVVSFGKENNSAVRAGVRMLARALAEQPLKGMVEYIPAFTSVTVIYDPVLVCKEAEGQALGSGTLLPYEIVVGKLDALVQTLQEQQAPPESVVYIPVCYGGEFGPDLEGVAALSGLSVEEVISIHHGVPYQVHMLGFAPGFPYLGGMDRRIAAPRKATPRLFVPAGSVGIAGEQTGVYPISTPGGWQLIGRTPAALFLPDRQPPALLKAGDMLRFYPITRREYETWEGTSP